MAADQRNIVIGADHGGYALKEELKEFLKTLKINAIDGMSSSHNVQHF
jgi:ribose 5-phosphate isomerase RpiB